jgi:hypothetical protein
VLVVDPHDWLTKDGSIPTHDLRLRRNIIRVARFIGYGGLLEQGEYQQTLIECTRKPGRKPCLGLMVVTKTSKDPLLGFCPTCGMEGLLISIWQNTRWRDGAPLPLMLELPRPWDIVT